MNITIGAYAGYAMIDGILTEVTVKHITLTNNGKLIYFSIYCLIVGLLVILFL